MKKRKLVWIAAAAVTAAALGACSHFGGKERTEQSAAAAESVSAPDKTDAQTDGASQGAAQSEANSRESGVSGEKTAVFLALDARGETEAAYRGFSRFADEADYLNSSVTWKGGRTEEKLAEMVEEEAAAGFRLVVCSGGEFAAAVNSAGKKYRDTVFVLVDDAQTPYVGEKNRSTGADNVFRISWAEEQAGFLAGYAAVRDGNRNLGFIGVSGSPGSVRYGYGFTQGADAAALEMEREITVRFAYAAGAGSSPAAETKGRKPGEDSADAEGAGDARDAGKPGNAGDAGKPGNPGDAGKPGNAGDAGNPGNTGNAGDAGKPGNPGNPEHSGNAGTIAGEWFSSGTEVIFADGEENGRAVLEAAEGGKGRMIGSGRDWSEESEKVLTSAVVRTEEIVCAVLKELDSGAGLSGGGWVRMDVSGEAVCLPFPGSRFRDFQESDYEVILENMAQGNFTPARDAGEDGKKMELSDLTLTNTELGDV